VAGAFTGAARFRLGLLESAHEGTFLLDEVAEVSPGIQAKLLRVLENGEVRRLGENETRQVQVRVVAATNRDLGREVEEKRFRRDLYYRLNTVSMRISGEEGTPGLHARGGRPTAGPRLAGKRP
jgi:transcriptional regulator with GAF, ATPase, and Fis domain